MIPVYELYAYLERAVAEQTDGRQTVSYFPLDGHDTGQYVFLVPGVTEEQLRLPLALPLLAEHNPYLGLAWYDFTPEHEALFKGWGRATDRLEGIVAAGPLTVVVGPSGSGKSSLVRAGVMRRLAGRPDWLVLPPIQPGSAPLVELAKGLIPLVPGEGRDLAAEFRGDDHALDQVASGPRSAVPGSAQDRDDRALERVASDWLNSAAGQGKHLLLCIDQFEELVTQLIPSEDLKHYCRLLARAVEGGDARLHVVLTVRSDYEGQFGRQPSLAALWADALRDVPPLERDDLREIVVGPATERALVFDPPALADELADAVAQQPGTLPLLSFTLWKLYRACAERVARTGELEDRRLTRDDYKAIGFLTGALGRHADDLLEELPDEEQPTLRRVMLRLVDLTGTEAVKRRVPKDELLDYDEPERGRVERVLGRLDAERLVIGCDMVPRADATENVPCAEPAHDALIRRWTTLRQWIEDEQNKVRAEPPQALPLIIRRRLTDDALEWAEPSAPMRSDPPWHNSPHLELANRHLAAEPLSFNRTEARFLRASEERRRVLSRRFWSGVAAGFALVGGLAVVALILWFLADDRAKVAESQRLAAQARIETGPHLPLAHLLSLEAYRVRDTFEARSSMLYALNSQPALVAQHRRHNRSEVRRAVYDVALSGDGRWLASGGADGTVVLCDAATGRVSGDCLCGHGGSVLSLAFSPDSRTLVSAGLNDPLFVWDLERRAARRIALPQDLSPECVAFSPDGRTVAAAGQAPKVFALDLGVDPPAWTLFANIGEGVRLPAGTRPLAFSPQRGDAGGGL